MSYEKLIQIQEVRFSEIDTIFSDAILHNFE